MADLLELLRREDREAVDPDIHRWEGEGGGRVLTLAEVCEALGLPARMVRVGLLAFATQLYPTGRRASARRALAGELASFARERGQA